MRVYLVQHGRAKPEDVDPDRHLTQEGIDDVKRMSAFLKKVGLHVNVIWHSGKTRAIQTAKILATDIIAEQGVIQHDGLSPNDDISPVEDELIESDKDIMIVGHLPFLSRLASALVSGNATAQTVAFQPGGVVCLEQAEDKIWRIRWIVTPELPV